MHLGAKQISTTLKLLPIFLPILTMNCNNVMFAGIIFSTDYSVYDAIVIVGGDGSYRDAITAIYEKMHNQVQSPKQPHPALFACSVIYPLPKNPAT